jgi:site-specific recombinase XerD
MPKPKLAVLKPTPATVTSVEDYLAHVRARGLSLRTIRHYDSVLRGIWLWWLADQGIESLSVIDQRALDRLNAKLLKDGGPKGKLAPHSVHSYLGTISHYLSWARKDGEFTHPTAKIQMNKLPQLHLDVLSRKEVQSLEDAAATERDKLLVRVLADTGLRVSEMLGLTRADMREEGRDRFIKVHGKGRRDRLVPVMPALYQRLRRYADNGRPKNATNDHIFLTARESRLSPGDHRPLLPRAVQEMLQALADRTGIKKKCNPHSLRHQFATWCLRRGMNTVLLQQILGHADLSMISRVYAHLAPTDAAAAMMAVHRAEGED